ncbi:MAG: hypothetical protein M1611_00660 [Candidatus Marsarchaeota archaeon]|nr:hypothetical protein [Candidatus Marsarchaeota archaeon]
MAGFHKHINFNVDLYEIDMKEGWQLSHLNSLQNVDASLDYPGPAGALEAITLYNVSLENGVAVVQYNEESRKMSIVYLKGKGGLIETPVEIGGYYQRMNKESIQQQLSPILEKKENPQLFIVSTATYYDNSIQVKLMLMDVFLKVFS